MAYHFLIGIPYRNIYKIRYKIFSAVWSIYIDIDIFPIKYVYIYIHVDVRPFGKNSMEEHCLYIISLWMFDIHLIKKIIGTYPSSESDDDNRFHCVDD